MVMRSIEVKLLGVVVAMSGLIYHKLSSEFCAGTLEQAYLFLSFRHGMLW